MLRAVAIVGVILHHFTGFGSLLAREHASLQWIDRQVQYWTGVDLFFAISGYVIARSLVPALSAHKDWSGFWREAGAFWIRRAFRLLPSSWLWLAVLLLASFTFNSLWIFDHPVFGGPWNNLHATVAAVGFYYNFFEASAFEHHKFAASFAWWSLSLEEQFYLLLPVVAFWLRKRLWIALFTIIALAIYIEHATPLTMVLRPEAICLGVLIALWEMSPSWAIADRLCQKLPPQLRTALILCLLFLLGFIGTLGPYTHRIPYIAIVSALLVIIAAQNRGYLIPPGVAKTVALWIGSRSYGLYLIHAAAFLGAKELCYRLTGDVFDSFVVPVGMIALLVFVELNWRYVETPMRRYGARLAQRFRDGKKVRS
ncbi:acyltransferase family protein [Methylovirgula sp. 4M-Z18]|uniref:acyltransferase family protein n=1 Tax=Methylovirgula sp. 4M-Z18 TaxID=2293567 RepID=UPI0013144336|nr:acyltransferase [Methylovirgula sp. 4M-Z18]